MCWLIRLRSGQRRCIRREAGAPRVLLSMAIADALALTGRLLFRYPPKGRPPVFGLSGLF